MTIIRSGRERCSATRGRAREVLPGLIGEGAAAELTKAKGGRPRSEDPSVAVTLRIRRSSVEAYRQAGGDKWRKLAEKTLQVVPGRK